MRYITPLKAARGTGAAGPSTGTLHHWVLTVTSVALAILTPAFLLVMGNAIGLPSIWVLFAVLLGEGLMGILGMLLFIPLTSVCYTLLREQVHKRLGERAASGS